MFIHMGSRKVFVSPSTYHPDEAWVKQQARNVSMWLDDEGLEARYLIHDRDTKFSEAVDHLFRSTGIDIIKTPYESPVANCYAESWIGTLKRECLNHFFCLGLKHLDHIVQTYVNFYNHVRPHQSKENRPLTIDHAPIPIRLSEPPPITEEIGAVERQSWLDGLLNHYERKVA